MSWEPVYRLVKKIPRGRVTTYGEIAKMLRLRGRSARGRLRDGGLPERARHSVASRGGRRRPPPDRRAARQPAAAAARNRRCRARRPPDRHEASTAGRPRKRSATLAQAPQDRKASADSHFPRDCDRSILQILKGLIEWPSQSSRSKISSKITARSRRCAASALPWRRAKSSACSAPTAPGKTSTVEILEGMRTPDRGSARVCGLDPGKVRRGIQGEDRRRSAVHGPAGQTARQGSNRALRQLLPPPRRHRRASEALPAGRKAQRVLQPAFRRAEAAPGAGHGAGERSRRSFFSTSRPPASIPQVRREIYDIIEELKRGKKTVLLTTHYIEEAERLCDRVAIVDHGKVIATGHAARTEARLRRNRRASKFASPGPLANGTLSAAGRRLRLPRVRRHLRAAFDAAAADHRGAGEAAGSGK